MKVAVFDVCDTLYDVNTTFFFLDHYFQNSMKYQRFRKFTKLFVVKAFNHLFYKTFKLDLIRLIATRFLDGEDIGKVQAYSSDLVKNQLSFRENKRIVTMLNDYQKRGYVIVLMSGAYEFIIQEVADRFGVSKIFASKLFIVSNHYTGQFEQDVLLKKHEILEQELGEWDELVVVSDNKTDLELMQLANEAYALCNKPKNCEFWRKYSKIIRIEDY